MAAPQDKPLARNRDLGRGWGTRAAWLGDAAATGNKPLWLNTADSRYVRYFSVIHKKVQPLWHFPRQLEARLEQGEVLVQFTILRDGRIKALKVKRSSGFPAFDRIAVSAVRKAAPFQAIPEDLGTELQVICPFEFNNPLIR
jgi:TonB family protein